MAALDLLAIVDPGLASMPVEPMGRERGRMAMAVRVVGATAIMFSATILGVGVSQLVGVSPTNGPVAQASPSPDQNVLGETATAQPSQGATPTTAQETLTPLGTPQPPVATAVPYMPPPPTPIPTAVPTPIVLPSNTPLPSSTAIPTPAPTVPAAIADLVASPGPGRGEITLTWSAPADGGSPILGYTVCRGTVQGSWPDCIPAGNFTSFTDTALSSSTLYYYVVHAVNAIGPSSPSNEQGPTAAP